MEKHEKNYSLLDLVDTRNRAVIDYIRKLQEKGDRHNPARYQWMTLITSLGGEDTAGIKLKEAGILHWSAPNNGSNNETGFTALPGGYRGSGGWFYPMGEIGAWRTSTEISSYGWCVYMNAAHGYAHPEMTLRQEGLSIRCLKD